MILQPDFIEPQTAGLPHSTKCAEEEEARRRSTRCVWRRWQRDVAAQILYVGPFADEGPTIQRIHDFIHAAGKELCGKHHEIYLSDPRRTAPEKLKTIIRQPMK